MTEQELYNLFYLFVSTMLTVGAEYMRRRVVAKEERERRAKTTGKTPKYPKNVN